MTTETIQTATRHGLTIPAFAHDENAPGRANNLRGWIRAVEGLDTASNESARKYARRLAEHYAGAPRMRRGWALTEAFLAPTKDGRFY